MCPEDDSHANQLQETLAETPLQVDDSRRDDDSVYASTEGSGSFRTSLATSVLNYQYENGRRYHAFRQGSYLMVLLQRTSFQGTKDAEELQPNDEEEQDRMDLLHHIYTLALKLHLAPISSECQRVLDLGTGTGIWAMAFADEHPSVEVIGTDLSPIQPGWTPPNCAFEVDDFESDWPYHRPFDFIHARELEGCIADDVRFFDQAFKHLNSGGYLEMQAAYTRFLSDDDTAEKAKDVQAWCAALVKGIEKFGKPLDCAITWKRKLEEAGFEDVQQEIRKLPIGGWPKDPSLKELGKYQLIQQIKGAESYTPAVFSRVLGWSDEEIQVLISKVKKDFNDPAIHLYIPVYIIWGRKT